MSALLAGVDASQGAAEADAAADAIASLSVKNTAEEEAPPTSAVEATASVGVTEPEDASG